MTIAATSAPEADPAAAPATPEVAPTCAGRLYHAVPLSPEEARSALTEDETAQHRQQAATIARTVEAETATQLLLRLSGPIARLRARLPTPRARQRVTRADDSDIAVLIARSGLFVPSWYRREHAALLQGRRPFEHFMRHGLAADLAPNPFFDPAWYRASYEEARTAGTAPLVHYILSGAGQMLSPGPLFDTVGYLHRYPDLAREPDPLAHFLTRGMFLGRHPSAVRVPYSA